MRNVILIFLLMIPALVMAQPGTLVPFEAGGATHLLRYSAETEPLIEPTRAAIEHSIDMLLPLFDPSSVALPYQIVVDLLDAADPNEDAEADATITALTEIGGSFGDVSFTGTMACHIRVYGRAVEVAYAPFVIAHEMAHCMQDHYLNMQFYAAPYQQRAWWIEGTAEWLASVVYPDLTGAAIGSGSAEYELLHIEENLARLTDTAGNWSEYRGYGSVYFWEFLATGGGGLLGGSPQAVIDLLRALPTTGAVNEESFQDFLEAQSLSSEGLMEQFGLALARRTLTYQPTPAQLYGGAPDMTLPYSLPIDMHDYTIYLGAFRALSAPDANAVRLSTEGLPDLTGGLSVNVNTAFDEFTPINDGVPVTLCLPPEGTIARIVITRGDGDASAPFTLRFDPVNVESDECDTPPFTTAAPECIVGTWQLTNNPVRHIARDQLGMRAGTMGSPGITVLSIGADGTVGYSLTDFVLGLADMPTESDGFMTLNAALTGSISVTPDIDGTLVVTDFDTRIDSLSAQANINGFEMDMTDVVMGAAEYAEGIAPTPARIECVRNDLLDWWIEFEGRRDTWHFTRVG